MSNLAISMFGRSVEALFKRDYNLAESVIEKIRQVHKLEREAVVSSQTAKIEKLLTFDFSLRVCVEPLRSTLAIFPKWC